VGYLDSSNLLLKWTTFDVLIFIAKWKIFIQRAINPKLFLVNRILEPANETTWREFSKVNRCPVSTLPKEQLKD